MGLAQEDREMVQDITRLGIRTAVLLKGVMLQKVDQPTLEWGLRELSAAETMERYFPRLIQKEEYTYLLNLLHMVYSLDGQLDYQVKEYGLDSLKDDLQEINFSLQQIGERRSRLQILPVQSDVDAGERDLGMMLGQQLRLIDDLFYRTGAAGAPGDTDDAVRAA